MTQTSSSKAGGVGDLEERVAQALQAAGRELLQAACRLLEERALAAARHQGPVRQVKTRPRDLLTRFGWLRLERQHLVDRAQGRSFCPLDDALALAPRQHASP